MGPGTLRLEEGKVGEVRACNPPNPIRPRYGQYLILLETVGEQGRGRVSGRGFLGGFEIGLFPKDNPSKICSDSMHEP